MSMNRKKVIGGVVVGVAVVGWYLFRPQRLFINARVNESFPQASAQQTSASMTKTLFSGRFHGVAHATSGMARVHQLPDGKRVLRLTEFETSNGPDVQVYLVATADASDDATVKNAGFVSLGALKGNQGDQNYDLPSGIDLQKYRAVTIWCRRFGVNFGTAPLAEASAAAESSMAARSLAMGQFHGVAHESSGVATVFQLPDGKRVLRFTDFKTSNGPDVQVYLVAAPDAKDNDTVKQAGFIEIGPLKGNVGDQNYELPADIDLQKYRAVTIWCRRFGVNFATAPLSSLDAQARG
jgi:hypothetical protein